MRPKKRPKEDHGSREDQFETVQADHELFLQAFEKPTQIYRYLRTRSIVAPIFLNRSLWYMKHRRSVSNSRRKNFSIDSILEKLEAKQMKGSKESYKTDYMNITFTGFLDKQAFNTENDTVDVEAMLLKICHKKRKDVSSPVMQTNLGKTQVCVNPSSNSAERPDTLSVGPENFHQTNGHSVKSYVLVLRVSCPVRRSLPNGLCNGDALDSEEPPLKKRRNGKTSPFEEDVLIFGSELVIYDRHKRCLLTDGEYEMALRDMGTKALPKTQATWETVLDGKAIGPFEVFNRCPTLKFALFWGEKAEKGSEGEGTTFIDHLHNHRINNNITKDDSGKYESWDIHVRRKNFEIQTLYDLNGCSPEPRGYGRQNFMFPHLTPWAMPPPQGVPATPAFHVRAISRVLCYLRDMPCRKSVESPHCTPKKKARIFYQFMYNNNTRQQTEARDDTRCPWCSLNCQTLYSLLKHLRLCHARFNFMYVPHTKGARIDVSINERYDGSYVGNPQDLHSHIGYAFSRNGPVRRTPVTHVIVYRPKRHDPFVAEFMEPESDNQPSRQLVQGHNRLYFHTSTCQPIQPKEIDYDSENEEQPEWLRQKTINMIDDFSDVNEGEKELMKIWNLHIMEHNYIADCQLPMACSKFVEEHGSEIVEKNLCKNFLLHLVDLFDFSLIKPEVVQRTYALLENLRVEMGAE